MQALCVGSEDREFLDGSVHVVSQRGLRSVTAVLEFRPLRSVLVVHSRMENSGTVVPQCVFHCRITRNPVYKGISGRFSSRVARPRPRPRT